MTSDSFVGFVPNNDAGNSFVSDCQKAFRKTGLVLRRFGRNPNRKQFYPNHPRGAKHQYACNLPVRFATHYALYIYRKECSPSTYKDYKNLLSKAKILVDDVRKLYQSKGLNLNIV